MLAIPSPDSVVDAATNAYDLVLGHGPADLSRTPSVIIDEGPQRTVRRYRGSGRTDPRRAPVLLVPPLAAPATCFDLRRGCSLAEHLLTLGYPVYLVDYGPISFSDRALGLEHWVDDVLPNALRAVSEDAGGAPVQGVGWCLGGIMLLLAAAADRKLPIASLALVASPFDFTQVRMLAPVRRLASLTGGRLGTALYRMLGGAPAPLVSIGFRLTGIERYVTRPLFLAQRLHQRESIAHMQATDDYMANMLAYPGRTFGQLYHAFFRVNDLADGSVALSHRTIDLGKVRLPVMAVAGTADVLAPKGACHHVAGLLENAAEVRLESAPGGHLGVLTGMSARTRTWRYLDEWLAAHDPVRARRRPELRRASPRTRSSTPARSGRAARGATSSSGP